MIIEIKPAEGSVKKKKRVGRGQGSGMGKTASRGANGQRSRSGYKEKRGFEGGQQPLQRRIPKVGFKSRVVKPYAINVDRLIEVQNLSEITMESIKNIHKYPNKTKNIKLIGKNAKTLASKIKDDKITYSGKEAS